MGDMDQTVLKSVEKSVQVALALITALHAFLEDMVRPAETRVETNVWPVRIMITASNVWMVNMITNVKVHVSLAVKYVPTVIRV